MGRRSLSARAASPPTAAILRGQGGSAPRGGRALSSGENFLSRWSRRKRETKDAPGKAIPVASVPPGDASSVPATEERAKAPTVERVPLPPVESLTPESDFTPFMQPEVDAIVKRQALKKLFADPRFNVMDGLDVYIDDYSLESPLPEGWLEKMEQVRHLGIFKKEADPAAAPAPEPAAEPAAKPALEDAPAQQLNPMEEQEVAVPPIDTSSKEVGG
ncbi:MAG TPA: DUF3306 domain-containing protein [Usitatibacter sp.]